MKVDFETPIGIVELLANMEELKELVAAVKIGKPDFDFDAFMKEHDDSFLSEGEGVGRLLLASLQGDLLVQIRLNNGEADRHEDAMLMIEDIREHSKNNGRAIISADAPKQLRIGFICKKTGKSWSCRMSRVRPIAHKLPSDWFDNLVPYMNGKE